MVTSGQGPARRVRLQSVGAVLLVFEVGGTTVRAGRFDPVGRRLVQRMHRPTPNHLMGTGGTGELWDRLLDLMGELGRELFPDSGPDGVAVAYPGPVDRHECVLAAPTVLGQGGATRFPLGEACRARWPGARVAVTNDLSAIGYRYVDLGARDFGVVTVGSGVGHKIFLDGRPLVGPRGWGGEIGHLRVDHGPDAAPCECGGQGHVGAVASGRGTVSAIQRLARVDGRGFRASALGDAGAIDGEAVAAAFRGGDRWVREAVRVSAAYLGQALAALHLAVGVDRIIVVGGFALALGEPYRAMVAEACASACWDIGQDWDEIIELGIPDDDGGMIGAGVFALDRFAP
jgi:glucokinase